MQKINIVFLLEKQLSFEFSSYPVNLNEVKETINLENSFIMIFCVLTIII